MLQQALNFLRDFGIWGLFLSTAIEASSLPFPGATFVLIYGFLMKVAPWELVLISFINSIIFTIFSFIPFGIGYKVESFTKKKFDPAKIEKAQNWFRKYGEWSIALSRPLSIGNYISYLSGMSKIKPWRFALFTFIGAFPWNTLLLLIGNAGSLEMIQQFLDFMEKFGTAIAVLVVLVLIGWWYWRKRGAK